MAAGTIVAGNLERLCMLIRREKCFHGEDGYHLEFHYVKNTGDVRVFYLHFSRAVCHPDAFPDMT